MPMMLYRIWSFLMNQTWIDCLILSLINFLKTATVYYSILLVVYTGIY